MSELKKINGPVNIVGELEATSLDINGAADISGAVVMGSTLDVAGNIVSYHANYTTDAFRVTHNSNDVFLSLYKRSNQSTPDVILRTNGNSYINGGNLGIGTTSPNAKLEILGSNNTTDMDVLHISNLNDSAKIKLGYDGNSHGRIDILDGSNNVDIRLSTNTASYFNTGQNFGIGTASPSDKVEVYSNGADVALRIHEDAGTHQARLHLRRGGSDWEIINDNHLIIEGEGVERFRINTSGNATFASSVDSQGYTINESTLAAYHDFQSRPIDADSGMFTVGGHGMQGGYTRSVSMWSSTNGVWNSWVGTNLRWDGTNFKRASDNGGQNWGNIAGIRFLGNSSTSGAAMQFIIDPPEQSSAPSGEQTIGTSLPASMTALSLNNDLSATFAGMIISPSTVYVGTSLAHYGDGDTNVTFDTNDLKLKAGGATHFHAASDQTTTLYSGNSIALTLDTSQNATFAGNVTLPGIVLDGNTITGVDDSGEFTDDDAHIMTSAGANDRFTNADNLATGTVPAARVTDATYTQSTYVNTATDWDTLVTPGTYKVASGSGAQFTGTGRPITAGGVEPDYRYGHAHVTEATGQGIQQTFYPHSGVRVFFRTGWNNGNWQPWHIKFTTGTGIILDGNIITGIDDSGEFTDNDAHIMTSAAVQDKILSYGYGSGSGSGDVTLAGTQSFTGAKTFGAATQFNNTVTVGADTSGHDVKFFGNATGEYMLWDESSSKLNIRHDTDDSGLTIFTVSSASMTQPQIQIGRDSGQYWGVYTDDRNAHMVHRQDETTGTMTTRFDQWDSNTSDNNGSWLWRFGNGTGGSMATALTLTQAGVLTATTFSGNLNGTINTATTATTQSASDNSTKVATTAYVDAQVATVVDSAPGTLNTLNELAAALGDDASFSTTVTNSIAAKLPLAGGNMTGAIAMGNQNITGVNEIEFDDGFKLFGGGSNNYLKAKAANTTNGGIIFQDGDSETMGYIYWDGASTANFGFLDATGTWAVRCRENEWVRLHYDNSIKLQTKSDGVDITGELQCDTLDVDGNADISGNLSGVDTLTCTDLTIGSDATTAIGKAYLKTPNVSTVSYQRINADETLSLLNAAQMLSAIGGVAPNQNTSGSSGSCTGNAATATKISSITNSNIVQLSTTTTQTGTKTFSGVIDITNTTASSNATGDTGALRCEGGASIAGKIYAGSTITGSADVIAFSDRKLKENIETLDGKKVLDMRGVSFTRKDTGAESSGVIAQEIQDVAPELVHDTEGTLGVAYGNLVGYLIEAIKDQQKQIDELKEICNGCSK